MTDKNASISIRANSVVVVVNLPVDIYNLHQAKRKQCRDAGSWIKTAVLQTLVNNPSVPSQTVEGLGLIVDKLLNLKPYLDVA